MADAGGGGACPAACYAEIAGAGGSSGKRVIAVDTAAQQEGLAVTPRLMCYSALNRRFPQHHACIAMPKFIKSLQPMIRLGFAAG